jgi:1,4-alpha-glucan branching enzyme
MIKKTCAKRGQTVCVTFELPPSVPAHHINVVGDFCDWEPTKFCMNQAQPDGNWTLVLELQPGHRYRFRYLIDDRHWLNDMFADDHVENPYGSYDSVIDLREYAQN